MAGIFEGILVGIGILSQIGGILTQEEAAKAQEEELKQQQIEVESAEAQRTIQRTQKLTQLMQTQEVTEVARGISVGSGSFDAIQLGDYNKFTMDQQADKLNTLFKKSQILTKERIAKQQEKGGILGSILNIATGIETFGQFKFGIGGGKSGKSANNGTAAGSESMNFHSGANQIYNQGIYNPQKYDNLSNPTFGGSGINEPGESL